MKNVPDDGGRHISKTAIGCVEGGTDELARGGAGVNRRKRVPRHAGRRRKRPKGKNGIKWTWTHMKAIL